MSEEASTNEHSFTQRVTPADSKLSTSQRPVPSNTPLILLKASCRNRCAQTTGISPTVPLGMRELAQQADGRGGGGEHGFVADPATARQRPEKLQSRRSGDSLNNFLATPYSSNLAVRTSASGFLRVVAWCTYNTTTMRIECWLQTRPDHSRVSNFPPLTSVGLPRLESNSFALTPPTV